MTAVATGAGPSGHLDPAGVVLHEVRWTDLAAVSALEAVLFPDDAWSAATWWSELAARPRREYVLARLDDEVVGYGGVDHGGDVADVMTVAVAPAARGRGLGRTLLAELERRASAAGAHHVMLEVRADNAPARALYAAAGFDLVSTRRGYYQPGSVDALVLRKTLSTNGADDG